MASSLPSHRKKLARERQFFTCAVCLQFSTATTPASHTKAHTGEACSRGVAKLAGLQAHTCKRAGQWAFHCDECGKSFAHQLHLRQHMQA